MRVIDVGQKARTVTVGPGYDDPIVIGRLVIRWRWAIEFRNRHFAINEGRAMFPGWTATSAQCRRELTEESLAANADREKRPANGVALLTMVLMMQAQKMRGNKRQGWTPDGQSLEVGA